MKLKVTKNTQSPNGDFTLTLTGDAGLRGEIFLPVPPPEDDVLLYDLGQEFELTPGPPPLLPPPERRIVGSTDNRPLPHTERRVKGSVDTRKPAPRPTAKKTEPASPVAKGNPDQPVQEVKP
jgi:hypothetical protein